jgi:hypothetical protein
VRRLFKILRLLLDTFFLLFELFKLVDKLDFSFVEFHCVRLLCLLNCYLGLDQKLSDLPSDGHSFYFSRGINNYNLRYPFLSVIIEKQLSNRIRHGCFMK